MEKDENNNDAEQFWTFITMAQARTLAPKPENN